MLDTKAFRKASYGVYLVTAAKGGANFGCVINTFVQVTSKPAQASIAINKENATTAAVLESEYFGVSILSQDAPMELIGRFGFKTSTEVDKFAETAWQEGAAGVPVVTDHATATLVFKVAQTLDVGTHMLVIGEAVDAQVLDADAEPLTYAYYHLVKGGKTPPKASSYEGEAKAAASAEADAAGAEGAAGAGADAAGAEGTAGAAAKAGADAAGAEADDPATPDDAAKPDAATPKYAWQCTICGHIEYVDELPDDFVCPLCGMGKDMFERIEIK